MLRRLYGGERTGRLPGDGGDVPKRLELGPVEIEGPSEAGVGETVTFRIVAEDLPEETTTSWRIDGPVTRQLEGRQVEITFPEPGTYTVSVTVTAQEWEPGKAQHTVTVKGTEPEVGPAPVAPSAPGAPPGAEEGDQTSGQNTGTGEESPPQAAQAAAEVTVLSTWLGAQPLPARGFTVMAAGDLDGDGKADLALSSAMSSTVTLLRSLGDGTFTERKSFSAGLQPSKLLVGDFNGDARGDIVAVNWDNRVARLFLDAGRSLPPPFTRLSVPKGAWEVFSHQLNDNAGLELVWLTQRGPVVWSFLSQGIPIQWSTVPGNLSFVMPSSFPHVISDLDRDGILETVYYSHNPGDIILTSRSAERVLAFLPEGVTLAQLVTGDIDGDGIPELLGLDQLGRLQIWQLTLP